jgi:hypothetical protein
VEYSDERILEALTRWRDRDWQPERGMDVDETSRADSIVIASLIGQRVRLVFMDNKKAPYGPGEEGTVFSVDDDGTVVVDWDRGPNYPPGLVPDRDRWEWLGAPPRAWFPDGLILDTLLRIKNDDESMPHHDDMVRESLPGRRVRLVFTNDEFTRLEPGDEGWVSMVDDGGTIHVHWDRRCGGPSGLLPGIDRWEWL